MEADLVTHSQATGHSFPWKLFLPGTGEVALAWEKEREEGNSESRAQRSRVEMRDSTHDTPKAPFRTQQALLVFDDKTLGGHTAEEADVADEENHPPPEPLRLYQHCPLTLPFNIYHPP